MKNIPQIILLFLIPTILMGQTKYPYVYKASLKPQLSTFTMQIKKSKVKNDSALVDFKITDRKGHIVGGINIGFEEIPSEKIQTDFRRGQASIMLPGKSYTFFIDSDMWHTGIKIPNANLNPNTKVTIKIVLGNKNTLRNAVIRSKRRLTQDEIEKIIDDLSNGNENRNPLILNETCLIGFEI